MKLGCAMLGLLLAACGGGGARKPTILDFELDPVSASSPSGPANPAPMPVVGGSGLRSTVRGSLAKVAFCYQKALASHPQLVGTVTLHFTVGPEGTVIQSSADGDGDAAMHDCMAAMARQFAFAPDPDRRTLVVNYPFQLSGP